MMPFFLSCSGRKGEKERGKFREKSGNFRAWGDPISVLVLPEAVFHRKRGKKGGRRGGK